MILKIFVKNLHLLIYFQSQYQLSYWKVRLYNYKINISSKNHDLNQPDQNKSCFRFEFLFDTNLFFLRRNRLESTTDLQSVAMPGGQINSRSGSGIFSEIYWRSHLILLVDKMVCETIHLKNLNCWK